MSRNSLVSLLVLALVAVPAYGTNYVCSGTINQLGMVWDGTVIVGGPGGLPPVLLCSTTTALSNGVTPQACKGWYAYLLSAKLSGQPVTIYFSDALTCTTQPSWVSPVSVYFIGNA